MSDLLTYSKDVCVNVYKDEKHFDTNPLCSAARNVIVYCNKTCAVQM